MLPGMAHTHDHSEPDVSEWSEQAWDARYRERTHIWSGEPNAVLVAEVEGLRPGTALDVGAGEGADAVWLARRGWVVTAADLSGVALERAREAAARSGVEIAWLHADLAERPAPMTYDLVTSFFVHVPRASQPALFANLAAAVAPGGTLLLVGHDLSDLRAGVRRPNLDEMGWSAAEVAAGLGAGWTIEIAQARAREARDHEGHGDVVHDAVLRARRS